MDRNDRNKWVDLPPIKETSDTWAAAKRRMPAKTTFSYIAGEVLLAGDFVAIDPATGKLVRCPQGQRYLCVITRDYQAGEVVTVPWSGV